MFKQEFVKFCLVGLANTALGAAVMFLLFNLAGCSYWVSSAVSMVLGSVLSFYLNKNFTFGVRNWSVKMAVLFAANVIVCYLTAYKIAEVVLGEGNLALLCGMCLFTLMNFFLQKFVVFNKPSAPSSRKRTQSLSGKDQESG